MTDKEHCCDAMATHLADEDLPIVYSARFREYGLMILDGGTAKQLIEFCPWCGQRLPESLRGEWFDRIERLGLEPEDTRIPDDLKSDAWWRQSADLAIAPHHV